ncbi:MAG: hypothetical protein GX075_06545 [Firmicutes bacterium]|nr:hypothetical protein [Bacillota bacterium]
MAKTLTGRFKVETAWPELVNKRIQGINCELKEIQFRNQAESLMAKGAIKRQVRYLDSDGKCRKTEDKLQFEVVVGTALPEPLPFFTAELKSDYFIFQPRRLGESQAMLEQGFVLLINCFEENRQDAVPITILTEVVAGKGKGRRVLSFPLKLQRDSRPKKFNGVVSFNRDRSPVVGGRIAGVVVYRNFHNILKEQEVNFEFSILCEEAPKEGGGELVVNGGVMGVDWLPPTGGQGWLMELKLDYDWKLIIRKELSILRATETSAAPATVIKADSLVKQAFFRFPKIFRVEGLVNGPSEAEPKLKKLVWKRVNSGLLISAVIEFELFIPDPSGMEKYRVFSFEAEELVADFFADFSADASLVLDLSPELTAAKIMFEPPFFLLKTTLGLTVKVYQATLLSLVQENAAAEILALAPAAEKNFSFLSEAFLNLSRPHRKLIKITNQIKGINQRLKDGWLNLSGVSEVSVAYLDRKGLYREELFRLFFQQNFYWKDVNGQEETEIELTPRLEYESVKTQGNQLRYQYLWSFKAALFHKRNVNVAVAALDNAAVSDRSPTVTPRPTPEIIIEGEIPLEFGNPREIASSRALITGFSWREALNAVLVEGRIGGEIEYWDEEGYLRRETVDFPFWRFLEQPLKTSEIEGGLVPRLRRFGYFPLKPWPWKRGAVRYEVEIEFGV